MKKLITLLLTMTLMTIISAAPPVITSFNPSSGAVGISVTIIGTEI